MREAHPLDREIGIAYYASDVDGTGGELRHSPDHFRVDEIPDVDLAPIDADSDAYPHLVVRATLTGWDTYGFVHRLAGDLGISRERIRWAGTKDKAAVTTQLFSIEGIPPVDLPDIDRTVIEPVGRFGRGLTFGDLLGNAFELTVTDPADPDAHRAVTESLTSFGGGRLAVPNYFGHQRFGTLRPITHTVGFRILERDWEGAVMTYLAVSTDREPADTREARDFVAETRDWDAAYERFPGKLQHERRLLDRLRGGSEPAYRDALEAFPRSLRRLFVHAAQSNLFNRIISERFRRGYGSTEALVGDTVCFTRETDRLGRIPDPDRTQIVSENRVRTIERHLERGSAMVTAPLIGFETDIADGEAGDIVAAVLDEAGLEPSAFDLPEPYGSTGTRRSIVVHPDLAVDDDPLQFSFALPSGSYATVVMREYLKGHPETLG